jgi:RNA polymerase sigma factor (sigma-70 family)
MSKSHVTAAGVSTTPTSHDDVERRTRAAVQRIGDARAIERVGVALVAGTAPALFALLLDDDHRVVAAAHECALLRLGHIVAIVAKAFRFDAYQRDELVQRTFLALPQAVARASTRGEAVARPDRWLRGRAYLIATQMLRDELGDAVRDPSTGAARRDAAGRIVRTRGTSVPLSVIDVAGESHEDTVLAALDELRSRSLLDSALRDLAREHSHSAEVLRMHYVEGTSLRDIARMLRRTHGTVRNDAQRARERLAAIIEDRYPQLLPPHRRRKER